MIRQRRRRMIRIHMNSDSSLHSSLVLGSNKQLLYSPNRKLMANNPKLISKKFLRSSFTINQIKACSKHQEVNLN